MKALGIILIVLGILMVVFTGFNFTKEKNVANIGPIEVNKEENHHVGWPTYAGGIVALVGLGVLVVGAKKK